jgi:hypothetical protein
MKIVKNKYGGVFLDWHGICYGIAVCILGDFCEGNVLSFLETDAQDSARQKNRVPPHGKDG